MEEQKPMAEKYGATSLHKKDTEGRQEATRAKESSPSTKGSSFKLFFKEDIMDATNGLSSSLIIDKGRFGRVYKGTLGNSEMAIKIVTGIHNNISDELFDQEVAAKGRLRHENIIKLIGACFELRALVYEYFPWGTLEDGLRKNPSLLTWEIRTRIVYQICSALMCLHSNHPQPFLYGNVEPRNVLLDANLHVKLQNFSCVSESGAMNEINKRICDPEYVVRTIFGQFTDMFHFGNTISKILMGSCAEIHELIQKVRRNGSLLTIVDPTAGDWPEDVAELLAKFGELCCEPEPSSRLLEEMSTSLTHILTDIGIITESEQHEPKDDLEGITKSNFQDDESDGKGSESSHGGQRSGTMSYISMFPDYDILDATDKLSDSSKIGEGGFGKVYKGDLDNTEVAIKILNTTGDQGIAEFRQEIYVLGCLRHKNLVVLIGTCLKLRALVYEYHPSGSLEDCLKNRPEELTWKICTRIIYEICSGLMFLHGNHPNPVVHGDLKPHNVLLGPNFEAKLADFGLCRFLKQGEKPKVYHQTYHFFGSKGYIDPDFLETGKLTPGTDVYSFGKTIIRILTGEQPSRDNLYKVHLSNKTGSLSTIVDSAAEGWPEDIVGLLARFGLKCRKDVRHKSGFLRNFSMELKEFLDEIDN